MPLSATSVRWRCSSVSRSQRGWGSDGPTVAVRGGEQRLRRLVTWATSLDDRVLSFDPFNQPKEAGQRDYGGAGRFL
jgi:hypothetical protein